MGLRDLLLKKCGGFLTDHYPRQARAILDFEGSTRVHAYPRPFVFQGSPIQPDRLCPLRMSYLREWDRRETELVKHGTTTGEPIEAGLSGSDRCAGALPNPTAPSLETLPGSEFQACGQ